MLKAGWQRLLALLLALVFATAFFAAALADEYDPLYPEKLEDGHLNGAAAIVIEADSGDVIYEKNADALMFPASTTKIMTVWLALTLTDDYEQKLTVSENAVNIAPDESSAKLAAGEQVRLIDLMYAAMLVSGNDAATAIAEGLAGSVEAFAGKMNQAAMALGCTGTHFVNANGLHDENHYSTARDLAIISRVAMQNATFRQIVGTTVYTLPKDNIYRSRELVTGNKFILPSETQCYYEHSTGLKTGTTSAAGKCFVGSAARDGISLISVVLGASYDQDRYIDSKRLMEYGFSQYLSTSIAEIYAMNPRVIDISGFDLEDPEVGRLELKLRKTDAKVKDQIVTTRTQVDYWVKNFNELTVTEFTREFRAPIEEGEVMGSITYLPEDGSSPVVYELLASRSVAARPQLFPTIAQIISDAENDPNPFPRLTFELVFLYLLLPAAAVFGAIKLVKFLLSRLRRRRRVRSFKPSSRYYR